jgi:AcrR family transcriptional regulator
MGLRERKKEQTRALIAEIAWRLFTERGFDRVKVAEIAREASVSEATVFNYFPVKEDLFFQRMEAFGTRLVETVATRAPGEPVAAAFQQAFLAADGGLLARVADGDAEALERLRTVNRVIGESRALQTRELEVFAGYTQALARQLEEEGAPAEGVEAYVVANALMGVHRALVTLVRRRVLDGDRPERLAEDVRRQAGHAFALLGEGLAGYGVR